MKKSIWTQAKKQRVVDGIDYWLRTLALKPFVISYVFSEKYDPEDDGSLMMINCNTPYRSAKITVYPGMIELSNDRVNQSCAHEVTHILLDTLDRVRLYAGCVWKDEVEKVTEQLSMCMHDLAMKWGEAQDRVKELERPHRKRGK